jgi:hypothetical protein
MKRSYSAHILSGILIIILGLIIYYKKVLPKIGKAPDIKVEITPQRLERGKYLANNVYVCVVCHSKRDWDKLTGPPIDSTYGEGGEVFGHLFGYPGEYYAKNITPYALNNWTDGEILRAISEGVDNKGKSLFTVMPYLNFGKTDREDLYDIIAYIRSLKSIKNDVQKSVRKFPISFLINTLPKRSDFTKIPDSTDRTSYGKYIYTACACNDCHTKQKRGKPIKGIELAGGNEFHLVTGGTVRSLNITPDKTTGIGNWTEEAFIARFKIYTDTSFVPPTINAGDFNTVMPWMKFSTMQLTDLKAIYAYLKTVTPIKNNVIKFSSDVSQ